MVKLTGKSMKERLWPASIAALAMHGLMIAVMALGVIYPQGVSPQDFCVEVVFASPCEKKTSGSERESHAEDQPPRKITEVSHLKKASQQSEAKAVLKKTNFEPSFSEGGHPTGETYDAFPIFNPPPIYPYEAKRKRIQGVVLVRLSLTETGVVDRATTLPPRVDPLLEDAALRALHTWRFKPGARTLEVPIEFKLEA